MKFLKLVMEMKFLFGRVFYVLKILFVWDVMKVFQKIKLILP